MSAVFYKLPLQLKQVTEGNELPVCSLAQSVTQNLELLVTTRFGEHRSNPAFGCEIWELDFELISSISLWQEKLRLSLLKTIAMHEPRLLNPDINLTIKAVEKLNYFNNVPEIRKQVDILVSGTLHKTGEQFHFRTNLFLSPLSVD
ncbi:GPW/gp25 family protein [Foetidibacter luteolus]|uniref:GPW/gp25 family protein n=1 Tax=Foetidibacter luteolus TaxID=2608880 RepID=UPI001A98E385|nr:GPW/gp25 family protein [Foetidibacter luteolus]